ncbi:MAG: TIGR03087 family PEP-CTERM/XrtA system glycosyltransferase [Phycisphaerae bacterium]
MNILYLAHRIPYPPDKGDKLRAFRHIEHLARRHRVWCACFVDAPADRVHVAPLAAYCQDVAAIQLGRVRAGIRGALGLTGGGTITEAFYRRRPMRTIVQRWVASIPFESVVAFSSSMAQYALRIPAARRVLDMCDRDSLKWRDYAARTTKPIRRLYRIEADRLADREHALLDAFDATILVTDAEAEGLRFARCADRLHVVGNGVALPDIDRPPVRSATGPVVGFVGAMDYRPNVDAVCWFVAKCWPAVRSAYPTARFRIVGRSPTRVVRRLAGRPPSPGAGGIEVTGHVDDVTTEVLGLDVSVAPLRIARGVQNKVLEAMAAARPVVLTRGAATGIGAQAGRDYIIADTAAETASGVIGLLAAPERAREVGASARRFVADRHRWDRELERFEAVVTGHPVLAMADKPRWAALPACARRSAPDALREPSTRASLDCGVKPQRGDLE